jgi:SNF2 family DNA or RNA helicase
MAVVDRVIASIHPAKREPHRSAILARRWDVVIADEAHHLRNRNTQTWKFASAIQKQFILLLTATPVQNNLEELFNLFTLLEQRLRESGHDLAVFHGGLARLEKEKAIERFRGPARVLLCTEAGSEGRNLQFAHDVCNFD